MQTKALIDSIKNAGFAILCALHLFLVEETQRFRALLETFLRENVSNKGPRWAFGLNVEATP